MLVAGIDGVNGVTLKVHFNRFFVQYVSGDFTGSFLQGTLDAADFDTGSMLFSPGVVDLWAARRGVTQTGIPMAAGETGVLCTLTFKAVAATAGSTGAGTLTIDSADNMITVCPTGGGACTQAAPTVGSGTVTAQ